MPPTVNRSSIDPGKTVVVEGGNWRLLRIEQGSGTLTYAEKIFPEARAGDMFIVTPPASVGWRSSAATTLTVIQWPAHSLHGVLSLAEWHHLRQWSENISRAVTMIPGTRKLEKSFALLQEIEASPKSLGNTAKILRLIAMVFEPELLSFTLGIPCEDATLQNFQKLVSTMTPNEFLLTRSAELAHACGCSEAQFRKLFEKHFGMRPARARSSIRNASQGESL